MNTRQSARKDISEIDLEAAARFARLEGGCSDFEGQSIDDWIDADPRHAVAFAKMRAAWNASERLKALDSAELDNLIAEAESPWRLNRRRIMFGGLAAAGVAAAAAVPVALLPYLDATDFQTQRGEIRDERLPDGSVVHLNTDSEITLSFDEHLRKLALVSGEASFDVAHDPSRPFDVHADGAVIRAVGTAFNVRLRDHLTELTVTEGVVEVHANGSMLRVVSGAGAVVGGDSIAPVRLGRKEVDQRIAWRRKMIDLDGVSLDHAVEEFNRYREAPIVLGDERLSTLVVGGRFATDRSDTFLLALASSLPVKVQQVGDGKVLLLYQEHD